MACPVFFWRANEEPCGVLSNWASFEFTEEGVKYVNGEQYIMARKARAMGDAATLAKIMAETNPGEIKSLGRKVQPWNQAKWDAIATEVASQLCYLKASQNMVVRTLLLSTGDRPIGEASPHDLIWGIGATAENAPWSPEAWAGKNLLGKGWMHARDRIRAEVQ